MAKAAATVRPIERNRYRIEPAENAEVTLFFHPKIDDIEAVVSSVFGTTRLKIAPPQNGETVSFQRNDDQSLEIIYAKL